VIERPGFGLVVTLVAAIGVWGLPSTFSAFLIPIGVVWAVGLPWARSQHGVGAMPLLRLVVDAAWFGIAFAVLQVAAMRLLSLPADAIWPLALGLGALGEWRCRRVEGVTVSPVSQGERRAVAAVVLAVVGAFLVWWSPLQRPLEDFWWLDDVEEISPVSVSTEGFEAVGWPEAGVVSKLIDSEVRFDVDSSGDLAILAQGEVGLVLKAQHSDGTVVESVLTADPVERPEEGAVPRYLNRGVVGAVLPVDAPGQVTVSLSSAARVFLLPTPESAWSVHASGALRFVHYYQILNLVENQRWASEMLVDRWGTVSQPPLWSNLLALQTLVDPDLPGASALFFWVLVLAGLTAIRLLDRTGEGVPELAWLLPATALVLHARLMIEPGSINFPDSLYTAALIGGLLALKERRWAMFGVLAFAASMLRYPGAFVLFGAVGLELIFGRLSIRSPGLRRALVGVIMAVFMFAVIGLVVGQFGNWIATIGFEIGPEHWHGDYALTSLLPRAPGFYGTWLAYAGGVPILVLLICRGESLRLFMVALAYSLLLCTIDHRPSHYFLPLLWLTAVSFGSGVGRINDIRLRTALSGLAVLAMWITLGIVNV